MRYVLLLALAILAVLYFTTGLRLGRPDLTDTYLLNVTGKGTYQYRTFEAEQHIGLSGVCDVKKGQVTLRFLDPQGAQVAGQACSEPGRYSLNLSGGGLPGFYTLQISYQHFTGHLKLDETHYGAH